MTKAKPPKEAGGACNAAQQIDNALILVQQLKQVNLISPRWTRQGWSLFAKWERSKNPKDLIAFRNQVEGIVNRLVSTVEAVR